MSKKLVIYYSLEGHTKKVAEFIASLTQADICELKPKKEIKSSGFSKYFWGGSQVFMAKSPELMPMDINFDEYDEIYLGTPIWAWTFAPPIRTILEGDYLKNKDIYYFYTHGGGPGKAEEKSVEEISKNNKFISAMSIFDKDIREDMNTVELAIKDWLKI